jgi:hypothetical protein
MEDDMKIKPELSAATVVVLVWISIAALVAFMLTLDVGLDIGPTVPATAICPDGSPVHLVIPVDCLETCGVNLPAEKELENHERK